ncbi:hypothetical protein GLYMA_03G019150v4 [Glycine max]|nr:hypothetical protein GLYMA_03G019150v4 [Glycine max]KAH1068239.1 hypothetical protein GYH30_005985 [Glycine max]
MLMHYKPSMSLLCFCRKFPPTPFFWFLLLLILLSNASANGVKQKNFYIVFLGDHAVSRDKALIDTHLNILSAVKGTKSP